MKRHGEFRYEPIPEDRILAIDPIAIGFGFVVLEAAPLLLVEWGIKQCDRRKALHCAIPVGELIGRCEPTAIVIEEKREAGSLRRASLARFTDSIADLLDRSGLPLYTYTRGQVRTVFSAAGAVSKEAIARALAGRFPELTPRLPKRREVWEAEQSRMSIFDALSLAVTHLAADRRDRAEAHRH